MKIKNLFDQIQLGKKLLIIFVLTGVSLQGMAWGGRGHDVICEVATNLVQNKELKTFLKHRSHTMGHLCNVPDIYWKGLSSEARRFGDPAHYIDPEVLGLKVQEIPLDYKKIIEDYTGHANGFNPESKINFLPNEFGSNWWRVDQFMRRLISRKEDFAKSVSAEKSVEDSDDKSDFNKLVYDSIVDMGLMGHFVGDNSQPYHTSADYDGYKAGHGGIHSYYEEAVVAQFDADLGAQILSESKKISKTKAFKNILAQKTTLEKMRALAEISHAEIQIILKKDPILKKSEEKSEKGMKLRTPAERKSAHEGLKIFGPMIVADMARGALVLAHLWDEAYVQMGTPAYEKYRSFKYPFTPDYIAPDYFEKKEKSKE